MSAPESWPAQTLLQDCPFPQVPCELVVPALQQLMFWASDEAEANFMTFVARSPETYPTLPSAVKDTGQKN